MHPALYATLYVVVGFLIVFVVGCLFILLMKAIPIMAFVILIFCLVVLWYIVYDFRRKDWL